MNPEDILAAFDMPYASYQRVAMDAAVEQRSALTPPLLLRRLESASANLDTWLYDDVAGLLYTLVLLGLLSRTRGP